jgi:hypothetical protein
MYKKTRNIALMAGALAAIGFGGSALSSAGAAPVSPVKAAPEKVAAPSTSTATTTAGDAETTDETTQAGDAENADDNGQALDEETSDGPGATLEASGASGSSEE